MKRNSTIIISSLAGSFIFTIIIILLLPFKFNKYTLEFDQKRKKSPEIVYSYSNLDSVSDTELFIQGIRDDVSYVSFREYDSIGIHKGVIHEINWTVPFIVNSHPFFHDYDHDGLNEAFVFFIKDSIVVAAAMDLYDNMSGGPFVIVDTVKSFRGNYNPVVRNVIANDINKDGIDELVFTLTNTNGIFPRTIYIADFANSRVKKGTRTASVISIQDTLTNSEGKSFFLMSSAATGNCSDTSFKYHDYNSYLLGFDDNLEFIFEPKANKGFTSAVNAVFLSDASKPLIAALFVKPTTSDSSNTLHLFTMDGNLLLSRKVDPEFRKLTIDRNSNENRILLFGRDKCKQLDNNLEVIRSFISVKTPVMPFDIDMDGESEFLNFDQNNEELTIYRNDFSHPVTSDFEFPVYIPHITLKTNGESTPLLAVNTNEFFVIYRYEKNMFYFFRYLIYILIFIINFGLIFLILLYNKSKIEQRHQDENKLISYQLLALKNQLDPHFALNTLNAIGYLYRKNDIEKANSLFEKYSLLTRQTLISSNSIAETLKNELIYVKNYLDLEMYRYDSKFEYQIIVDETINIDTLQIPRMLIHTFVENSVKHGIKHLKDRKGTIEIGAKTNGGIVKIEIKDNGVGRKESKGFNKDSTGRGMEIANEMIRLYNKLHEVKLSATISDLELGTMVQITIRH